MFRQFLIAMQFMTVFRVRDNLEETPEDLAASVAWYPLVGLLLGLLLAGGASVASAALPPLITGLLLALALALLTQGLHLDGLADTSDGLFSHRGRARKLEIMKDSAVGVFGALALIFIIGLKSLLLAEAVSARAWAVIILFPLWGRWAATLTACLSTYARAEGGLGLPFINLAGRRELWWGGGASLAAGLALLGLAGVACGLIVTLAAVLGAGLWRRQIGGVTGDILGAVVETGECLGLMAVAVVYAI